MSRKIKNAALNIAIVLVRLVMFIFCPIKAVGKENIPKNKGVIICPNHISMFDIVCIFLTCPVKPHFMAKSELFNKPIKRFLLDIGGAFPVKRGTGGNEAIEHSVELINDNKAVCIFIEGTRTKNADGSPGKPKAGAVLIASQCNCEVIPVAICYKHNKPRLFCKNYVYYGEPIKDINIDIKEKSKSELKYQCDRIMSDIINLWKKGKDKWQK